MYMFSGCWFKILPEIATSDCSDHTTMRVEKQATEWEKISVKDSYPKYINNFYKSIRKR